MIDSRKILYSTRKNDECITPKYAVYPILKYIPKDKVIWCPFDDIHSEFVNIFKKEGYKVIYSHISEGKDFYTYEPEEHWDIIVSNPPYTNKRKIFERALSFEKPFALLMSNTWLNDSAPKQLFRKRDLQLLMFDNRIKYFNADSNENKITFSSSYYCCDLLPKQIIMYGKIQ